MLRLMLGERESGEAEVEEEGPSLAEALEKVLREANWEFSRATLMMSEYAKSREHGGYIERRREDFVEP